MHGVLIVDKPLGKTSFDIVRETRKQYNTKKVGHIGTLDPMATGVLAILIGDATKLSDFLMEHDKEYIAKLYLGEKRDTGDSEGKIVETKEIPKDINENKIKEVLKSFLGKSNQIPPMYSAIKVNGQKLYDIARSGQTVERKPREINIEKISLLKYEKNEIDFKVACSKGTYIRVLCEDIAEKLGTCGYMKELRRTRIGNFKIEDAGKFIDIEKILDKKIEISDKDIKKLINGVGIKVGIEDGLINLYYNKYIGIGQIEKGILKRKIIIEN